MLWVANFELGFTFLTSAIILVSFVNPQSSYICHSAGLRTITYTFTAIENLSSRDIGMFNPALRRLSILLSRSLLAIGQSIFHNFLNDSGPRNPMGLFRGVEKYVGL